MKTLTRALSSSRAVNDGRTGQEIGFETFLSHHSSDLVGDIGALALSCSLTQTFTPHPSMESPQNPRHLPRLSPDGQCLLSASWDGTVRFWKVSNSTKTDELPLGRPIRFATLSPDGQLLATSTYDPTIQLWRLSDKTLLRTLIGHKDWVHEVAFSPDGKFLVSGSKDGTVKVWRVEDGSLVRTLSSHSKPVVTVALSPDGRFVASGSEDSTVRIWRMEDGKLVKVLQGHMAGMAVNVVRFSPDGK